MKEKTQETYYKCTGCSAKFKKECPITVACSIVEKCVKCGSVMTKIGKPYNRSRSQ